MKLLVFAMILGGVLFAQPASPDEAMDQCMETCCYSYGGEWDGAAGACSIDSSDNRYQDLSDCQLQCVYEGTGVDTSASGCCCGPAVVLFALIGIALKKGR